MKNIKKIVITGGPCAGKSTAIKAVKESLENIGYTVLLLPELATELISNGISPVSCGSSVEYQKLQVMLQIEKEKVYSLAAKQIEAEKIVILCDRGVMDSKAYVTNEEFSQILSELGLNETAVRDNYDAVFHMLTTAKGKEENYTLSNNSARSETAEEARILDDLTLAAWVGTPHLRVIDNSSDFCGKQAELVKEIMFFLGEPEPLEIERKYLIEYPDLAFFERYPFCNAVEISQSYIIVNGERARIRKRGANGGYTYYKTIKKDIDGLKRIEIEETLSSEEYELLLALSKQKTTVEKVRYCLVYENRYFEIDVFPFSKDKAFLELELTNENEAVILPPFIKVIKEVTTDKEYKNSSIALKIAKGEKPF